MKCKSSRHKKTPTLAGDGASGNESNYQERNVMTNHSTAVSSVIPFRFEAKEVRTVLIDDQPWFVAQDVMDSLEYAEGYKPARALGHIPEQWKGVQRMNTRGGAQQLLTISEQGLYFFIGRSDKPKALPFQMWLAGEVLPAIRKHGRYEDAERKMPTLMDELIGMSELNVIKGLIRDKSKAVPTDQRQGFQLVMHNRLHTRFNVPRTELIPAVQFEQACNFIGSYALEGEFLGKKGSAGALNIHFPLDSLTCRRPEMLTDRGDGHAWLDVKISDLRENFRSPCEGVLCELNRAGYDVSGAWWEVRTLKNKLRELSSFATAMSRAAQEPQRYPLKAGKMA